MKQKIICLTVIAMFALSVFPLSLAPQSQISNPTKLTQEIAPEDAALFSDLVNLASNQLLSSSIDNSIMVKGRPPPAPKSYSLTIEIDYMEGHKPTQSVLDYMKVYYAAQGITITYDVAATAAVPLDNSVSEAEFWAIEAKYNAGKDRAPNSMTGKYTLPQKWVLFGTAVEENANVVGYTYCVGTSTDLVAGNYIYIADGAADAWANALAVSQVGAEAVLFMHEFGHSIGICIVENGDEAYCEDYYCVMSYLRTENAGTTNNWHYCTEHWNTKNISYYYR